MCVAPTANTPECATDAQCAGRTDGKTTCDVENEVCVAPTANTPECTTDAQCASRTDGKTTCDVENEVCVAPTANTPECGNGVVEAGESCDKNDLNGKQCDQYPDYIGGTLACNAACEFDKSGCFECTETDTTLCASSEICSNGHCVPQGHQITCGDNMAEGSEACDGTDLKGKSCADFDGFHDGTLKCNQCKFDTSSCVECSLDAHCADRTDGKTKCSANVCTKPASNPVHKVVISQIYPGGGNSEAVYNTKYIELHNIDESEVDISGWSIQYSGSNKDVISSTCKLPSNVKLPQGGYYLIAFGDAGTNGGELPVTTDYKCTSIQPAAANGKLFLVNSDKQLNTSKPTSGYIDAVGYGSANWAEGTPMAALSAKKAGLRKDGGCVDTNDNSNDFEADTPSPRNSNSAVNKCDGTTAEAFCGNNSAEAGEDCDGSDLRGKSCTDFAGFSGGTLKCTSCTFDKSACKKPAECGNGILETGEDCDEERFAEDKITCHAWKPEQYNRGYVSCKSSCTIDYGECRKVIASMCNAAQEWSETYQTCVYPINSVTDYENYVTKWNNSGNKEFPGAGGDDPAFLLKSDIELNEPNAWGTVSYPFKDASFYGGNHTISVYGDDAGERIFGYVSYAEIKDVKIHLTSSDDDDYRAAHAFVALNVSHSRISNVDVSGSWVMRFVTFAYGGYDYKVGFGLFGTVSYSEMDNIHVDIDMRSENHTGASRDVGLFLSGASDSIFRNISLNGSVYIWDFDTNYYGFASFTENSKWENCEINLDMTFDKKKNGYDTIRNAHLLFGTMSEKVIVDRMNIKKQAVNRVDHSDAIRVMLIDDTKACSDCVVSNLEDNTIYSNNRGTYFIRNSKSTGSYYSDTVPGLAIYNVLTNSNFANWYSSSIYTQMPERIANVLIQNQSANWGYDNGFSSREDYPYVYDVSDISSNKVTVNMLNDNRKAGVVGSGSYLPWGKDSKGRYYMKFDAANSDVAVVP